MKRRSSSPRKSSFLKFVLGFFQSIFGLIWKALPVLFITSFFYFTFLGIHQFLYADPYFQVHTVKVFPKGVLSAEEYKILERRCTGINVIDYDLRKLLDFLTANPRVKEASVHKSLPDTLEIFIVPRKAFVQIQLAPKGNYYVVDDEGTVMTKLKTPDPSLTVLKNYDYPEKNIEILERYQDSAFKKLPEILKAFQDNDFTKSELISDMSVDHLGQYSIFLKNGPELKVCDNPAESFRKLSAMGHLLTTEERHNILYIDLCTENVIVQPLPAVAAAKAKKAAVKQT